MGNAGTGWSLTVVMKTTSLAVVDDLPHYGESSAGNETL